MMHKLGLVMGKFMPLHNGHLAMIEFGLKHVETLIVLIVAKEADPIEGSLRMEWLKEVYADEPRISIEYMENTLPHDGAFRREDTLAWCAYIQDRYPDLNVFISSEKYGDILAEYMAIEHLCYDQERLKMPVSGTEIRHNPMNHLEELPKPVQRYYQEHIIKD